MIFRALLIAISSLPFTGCVRGTRIVEVERTRLVVPHDFAALTAQTPEPNICKTLATNGELFRCKLSFETALQQCNNDKSNLRSQYEQIQKPSSTSIE
jgi:hypothetical protein